MNWPVVQPIRDTVVAIPRRSGGMTSAANEEFAIKTWQNEHGE
jgi:hypothetical protein